MLRKYDVVMDALGVVWEVLWIGGGHHPWVFFANDRHGLWVPDYGQWVKVGDVR